MIPSNYTTRKNTRVVASGGSHVTAATVNGIDIGLQPNYLSHHAGRADSNQRFDEARVRGFIGKIGDESPTLEAAASLMRNRIPRAAVPLDTNPDPHCHDFIQAPPKNWQSSSRYDFYKYLVVQELETVAADLEEWQVDVVNCWDPEFILHEVAVTHCAAHYGEVKRHINFPPPFHIQMHMQKSTFVNRHAVLHFWSSYFSSVMPYRAQHWKSLSLKYRQLQAALEAFAKAPGGAGISHDGVTYVAHNPSSAGEGLEYLAGDRIVVTSKGNAAAPPLPRRRRCSRPLATSRSPN